MSRLVADNVDMTSLRPWKNFRSNPASLRHATMATVSVSVALVFAGAVLIRVFDAREYPTFGDAVWFTLQTITTVGYGDNPPVTAFGRIVASMVMLFSIALLTVITAIITSAFIQSAGKKAPHLEGPDETAESLARIEHALQAALERLDRIEQDSPPTGS